MEINFALYARRTLNIHTIIDFASLILYYRRAVHFYVQRCKM